VKFQLLSRSLEHLIKLMYYGLQFVLFEELWRDLALAQPVYLLVARNWIEKRTENND
jgi:hypothetical protein